MPNPQEKPFPLLDKSVPICLAEPRFFWPLINPFLYDNFCTSGPFNQLIWTGRSDTNLSENKIPNTLQILNPNYFFIFKSTILFCNTYVILSWLHSGFEVSFLNYSAWICRYCNLCILTMDFKNKWLELAYRFNLRDHGESKRGKSYSIKFLPHTLLLGSCRHNILASLGVQGAVKQSVAPQQWIIFPFKLIHYLSTMQPVLHNNIIVKLWSVTNYKLIGNNKLLAIKALLCKDI